MAAIARETINGLTGYYVRDEAGRIIAGFDNNGQSLNRPTEKRVTFQKHQGKSVAFVSCELPAGYSVICIFDHDADVALFIVAAPGRVLSITFPSPKAAIDAAHNDDFEFKRKLETDPEPDSASLSPM